MKERHRIYELLTFDIPNPRKSSTKDCYRAYLLVILKDIELFSDVISEEELETLSECNNPTQTKEELKKNAELCRTILQRAKEHILWLVSEQVIAGAYVDD